MVSREKVVCCVTDNAANIVKAPKILEWDHLHCLAHTINLIVREGLKEIKKHSRQSEVTGRLLSQEYHSRREAEVDSAPNGYA